ncbi:TolC family protein [Candidatus Magnetomonas plexicatena]|uniref:TolC family protein n=1 Tax=Candidatus Magnetomonas plexicatena TaxID=2552947 RepID=UPI001C74CA70|nr:TolC family protein [Nitrospirales bacterium LBB_01]
MTKNLHFYRIQTVMRAASGLASACLLSVFLTHGVSFAQASEPSASETMTISEGVAIAVSDENRIVKIAAQSVNISERETDIAAAPLLPSVNAEISQGYLQHTPTAMFGSMQVPMGNRDSLSYTISARQTIFDFGASISRYRASLSTLDAVKYDYERTKNLIVLEFIVGCYDTLEFEKLVAVSQAETERFQSHLKVARSLFKEGVITKNDLLQAEVKLADAKQRHLSLKNMLAVSVSKLNNILSRPLKTQLHIIDDPESPVTDMSVEHFWKIAEKQRLEIKIMDKQLQALSFHEKSKTAAFFPSFYVQGGYNYTQNDYQVYEGNWALIAGVSVNLFNGGSTRAEVSKLKLMTEKLSEERKKLIDNIRLDVQKYYLNMKSAEEKISVLKDSTQQATENLRINKIRYEQGQGTATDVLDAITLLTNAETNYFSALYDLKRASAGLMYLSGADMAEVFKKKIL